jgi:hypothetical protein
LPQPGVPSGAAEADTGELAAKELGVRVGLPDSTAGCAGTTTGTTAVAEQIQTRPPLVWVEILSSQDRPLRVNEKIREALAFGAQSVWVIDPETRQAQMHSGRRQHPARDGVLVLSGSEIRVPLGE